MAKTAQRWMSARERWLWIAAAIYVLMIYLTLYVARFVTDFLRARNALRASVWFCLLLAAAAVIAAVWRQRPAPREIVILAVAAAFCAVLLSTLAIPEERLHLPEYGVLGGLIYSALQERRQQLARQRKFPGQVAWYARSPAALAMLLTALCGALDEGIQAMLPNRVGALRDVELNAAFAVIVIAAMAGRDWARRSSVHFTG